MTAGTHEAHRHWDELVAAHALHALEPAEELRLRHHVDGCPTCRDRLDDFSRVAAQLGALADDEDRPPSWSDIRPRLVGVPKAADASAGPAHVLPLRRRVAGRMLAAAATVALAATGVGVGAQFIGARSSSGPAALTACHQKSGCRVIELHGQTGDNAAVLVEAGHASLVPVKLPAPPADRRYVLWQLPRDGSPIAVVTFDDATRQTSKVPLVTGYADTAAFAVSLEAAGPMPTRPTDVLAVGAASSGRSALKD